VEKQVLAVLQQAGNPLTRPSICTKLGFKIHTQRTRIVTRVKPTDEFKIYQYDYEVHYGRTTVFDTLRRLESKKTVTHENGPATGKRGRKYTLWKLVEANP
jgi:hypothetical protein